MTDNRTPDEKRQAVVFAARHRYTQQTFHIDGSSELYTGDPFDLPKGVSPRLDPRARWELWRYVLPPGWSDAQVDQYQFKHWCGGFWLASLKDAGLALEIFWKDGQGFAEPHRLKHTTKPQPGDGAWFVQNSHYAVIEATRGNMFDSIDGNQGKTLQQPAIGVRSRLLSAAHTFYSIETLLEVAP